jgi:hypothetical protein
VFAAFTVIGAWIAFWGDARHMSGGVPLLGLWNIWLVRIGFGLGALISALGTIAYAVQGARKLFRG